LLIKRKQTKAYRNYIISLGEQMMELK